MRWIAVAGLLMIATAEHGALAVAQDDGRQSGDRRSYYEKGTNFQFSDGGGIEQPLTHQPPQQAARSTRAARANHEQPVAAALQPSANNDQSLPLSPPKSPQTRDDAKTKAQTPTRAMTTVFGSLAIVVGLFFLVVWIARRTRPGGASVLPKEAVEVLGRVPLAAKQQLHLVRLGNKLLLLSVTANGSEMLSEISDADEVDRLAGLCQKNQPGSITATFRQVLSQLGGQSTSNDEGGDESTENATERRRQRRARSA